MIHIKRAVYAGSFDPVTNGHLDVIKRASMILDEVIVGVFVNTNKTQSFSPEERVILLKEVTKDIPNVKVESFSGLLVEFMHSKECNLIIRGLRAISDFEYELQIALTNRDIDKNIETIFLMTSSQYCYLSSSIVKEIARFGGNIDDFVPEPIRKKVIEKLLIKKVIE